MKAKKRKPSGWMKNRKTFVIGKRIKDKNDVKIPYYKMRRNNI